MTCSTWNNLYVKRCEILQRCGIWKGHHHIWSVVLARAKTMIITKNGTDGTTMAYKILYINGTSFSCRFRIWNQNSNIPSVASDIAQFAWINTIDDQFSHNRCSNRYNCYPCCQEVVLYVESMDQKSLYQISKYCLWWKPTSDICRFWQYITYLEGIPSPIPSCNACNTSNLMCIVRLKRDCHKILSIGECTYTTLPRTTQCANFSFILAICPW
jgi:hypothetical protein